MKKYYKIFKIGFDTFPADYCYSECCDNLTLLQVGYKEYETEEDAENAIANLLNEGKCEEYIIVKCYKKMNIDFFKGLNIPLNQLEIDIPLCSKEDYENIVIPALLRCGAIPKEKLELGCEYEGHCRNSDTAIWRGEYFEYVRYKFGDTYIEKINHFEDDDGYDVFVPYKKLY